MLKRRLMGAMDSHRWSLPLLIVAAYFSSSLWSGCISPAMRLERHAVESQIHPGQSRDEVRKIFGKPKESESAESGKSVDTYLVESYTQTGSNLRFLSVLYDRADLVEKHLLHVGSLDVTHIVRDKFRMGRVIRAEEINKIRDGVTNGDELEKIFGTATKIYLTPEGNPVMAWLYLEGVLSFSAERRQELHVWLDAKNLARAHKVYCRPDCGALGVTQNAKLAAPSSGGSADVEGYKKQCDGGSGSACYNASAIVSKGRSLEQLSAAERVMGRSFLEKSCALRFGTGCRFLAKLHLVDGRRSEAREAFTKGCDLNDAISCNDFAWNLVEKGSKEQMKLYEKACDLEEARGCENLALVHNAKGNAKGAKAANLAGCNNANSSNGCYALGVDAWNRNRPKEARAYFKRACDLKLPVGCVMRARDLVDAGRVDEAKKLHERYCNHESTAGCDVLTDQLKP